ncbi:MAG: DUF3228 family protein [Candidatus Melainabacteria bacterium]|nr:DUF3228 family protein [Candidatus Melainabacteria bacterium]
MSPEDSQPTPSFGISEFAHRYTANSAHSHFEGSWEELLSLVNQQWAWHQPSPHNPLVVCVPMPSAVCHRFYTPTVALTPETPLVARYQPRREGELAHIQVWAAASGQMPAAKTPAVSAEVILYHYTLLMHEETLSLLPDGSLGEFYLVAVKAYPSALPEPMDPVTMARNWLALPGGTKPVVPYTADEWAQAVLYWSRHASVLPTPDS